MIESIDTIVRNNAHLGSVKEDEVTWSKIDTLFTKLANSLKIEEECSCILECFNDLILRSIVSDRSKLCGTTLVLLRKIIDLGIIYLKSVHEYILALLKICCRSNKVFYSRGHDAFVHLCSYIDSSEYYKIFIDYSKSQNKNVRHSVYRGIYASLKNIKNFKVFEKIVIKGKDDPYFEVRDICKKMAESFNLCQDNTRSSKVQDVSSAAPKSRSIYSANKQSALGFPSLKKTFAVEEAPIEIKSSINDNVSSKFSPMKKFPKIQTSKNSKLCDKIKELENQVKSLSKDFKTSSAKTVEKQRPFRSYRFSGVLDKKEPIVKENIKPPTDDLTPKKLDRFLSKYRSVYGNILQNRTESAHTPTNDKSFKTERIPESININEKIKIFESKSKGFNIDEPSFKTDNSRDESLQENNLKNHRVNEIPTETMTPSDTYNLSEISQIIGQSNYSTDLHAESVDIKGNKSNIDQAVETTTIEDDVKIPLQCVNETESNIGLNMESIDIKDRLGSIDHATYESIEGEVGIPPGAKNTENNQVLVVDGNTSENCTPGIENFYTSCAANEIKAEAISNSAPIPEDMRMDVCTESQEDYFEKGHHNLSFLSVNVEKKENLTSYDRSNILLTNNEVISDTKNENDMETPVIIEPNVQVQNVCEKSGYVASECQDMLVDASFKSVEDTLPQKEIVLEQDDIILQSLEENTSLLVEETVEGFDEVVDLSKEVSNMSINHSHVPCDDRDVEVNVSEVKNFEFTIVNSEKEASICNYSANERAFSPCLKLDGSKQSKINFVNSSNINTSTDLSKDKDEDSNPQNNKIEMTPEDILRKKLEGNRFSALLFDNDDESTIFSGSNVASLNNDNEHTPNSDLSPGKIISETKPSSSFLYLNIDNSDDLVQYGAEDYSALDSVLLINKKTMHRKDESDM